MNVGEAKFGCLTFSIFNAFPEKFANLKSKFRFFLQGVSKIMSEVGAATVKEP